MGHRWNCPTDYEARAAARRDAEDGWSRHRFEECHEAHETYEREFRHESYRLEEEEEAEERRAHQREIERRHMEEREEEMRYEAAREEQMERAFYEAMKEAEMIEQYALDEHRVNADADPLDGNVARDEEDRK